ncbi:hypothetical protein BT63DRAFT_449181 [Microthyrium microscopicum]|uniref:Carbohydrate esterase family 16 protein n=1 Tax=Microthyrium microscopicum TaxID=703497 RepID=A0A6A6UPI4_9PEZI|nr:hypothetical protein BT63DRAFT_449181 [Microthyrium microscopicum]
MPKLTTTTTILLTTLALTASAIPQSAPTCKSWPGFTALKNLFIFGDSYTQTGFNTSLSQPSASTPLGNPPYPGWTSSNGPNWVDYLTVKYNASKLLTYNLAWGGATVDAALAKPYASSVHSLVDQVEKDWMPKYASGNMRAKWMGRDSLFGMWVGINDVSGRYGDADFKNVDKIFKVWARLVEELYSSGARNFLFMDVPTIERSPQSQKYPTTLAKLTEFEKYWAKQIADVLVKTVNRHADATVVTYSTYDLFERVLKDPKSTPQTSKLTVITPEFCQAYKDGNVNGDQVKTGCKGTPNQYFWLNDLHPTPAIHEATAAEVAKALIAVPANACAPKL